jgi:hypothetical protein
LEEILAAVEDKENKKKLIDHISKYFQVNKGITKEKINPAILSQASNKSDLS